MNSKEEHKMPALKLIRNIELNTSKMFPSHRTTTAQPISTEYSKVKVCDNTKITSFDFENSMKKENSLKYPSNILNNIKAYADTFDITY